MGEIKETGWQPVLSHAEPVLAVSNITETVQYWHQVIGFPDQWTWGEPPTHGGVSWHGAFIQFSCNPQLAAVSAGHSIWIRVRHIEALYAAHQEKNLAIVAPLTLEPYGLAQYTIREINGYFIHFAGTPVAERQKSRRTLPDTVRIVDRAPTREEFDQLAAAIYGPANLPADNKKEKQSPAILTALTAENTATGHVIGCAYLLGDNEGFYYVKNVMVHPDWQGNRIGTALMQELSRWLGEHAPDKAFIALHTPENLADFYKQFDFLPAFSMIRIIHREKKIDDAANG